MDLDNSERAQLRQFLVERFNLEELQTLAFDLGIDFQSFLYDNKQTFLRELITFCERRELILSLLTEIQRRRPDEQTSQLITKLSPIEQVPVGLTDLLQEESEETQEIIDVSLQELPETQGSRQHTPLEEWWFGRGYHGDPFRKFNASDLDGEEIPRMLDLWCVDPDTEIRQNLLVETALLDFLTSRERSPIFLYIPQGGGKTFYRRWAAHTINDSRNCFAVEIDNLHGRVHHHGNQVGGEDLVRCLYEALCNVFGIVEQNALINNVTQGLMLCDQLVEEKSGGQCFILLDGIETLFVSQTKDMKSSPIREAIIKLLNGVAGYESKNVAIRVFIPSFLRDLQDRQKFRGKIKEKNITWSPEHCELIIEKRLDSCWKEGPGTYKQGHIGKLLHPVALEGFQQWLRRQNTLSPRCIIRTFSSLIEFARHHGVTSDQIDQDLWVAFLETAGANFCTSEQARNEKSFITVNLPKWLKTLIGQTISGLLLIITWAQRQIQSLGQVFRSIIDWFATVQDFVFALFLLIALIGGIIFIVWCSIQSLIGDTAINPAQCFRNVWQFISALF